jgi:hypothetical protein
VNNFQNKGQPATTAVRRHVIYDWNIYRMGALPAAALWSGTGQVEKKDNTPERRRKRRLLSGASDPSVTGLR